MILHVLQLFFLSRIFVMLGSFFMHMTFNSPITNLDIDYLVYVFKKMQQYVHGGLVIV